MADSTTTPSSTVQTVIAFFAELVGRLFSKTPAFFKVIQVVSTIVAIVTGLPSIITSLGITLPSSITGLENTVVSIAGLVALFISSLPVATTVATSGTATASSAALPFTAAKDSTVTVTTK